MTILLLDGHNLLMRAYSTLPPSITSTSGTPLNAVYGLLGTVVRLARGVQLPRVAVALDIPEVPNFRQDLYPPYQAQRGALGGENAADFANQADMARTVLTRLGIPALSLPGFEADDVMGTLASAGARDDIALISTDKDLLQLVRPGVRWETPQTPPLTATDPADVERLLGVLPSGVTTYKALAGDSSDNYPGVRGVGPKTAVTLVREYHTLENIFEHLQALPPATATKLRAGQQDAFLFRQVATIRTDLNLSLGADDIPPLPIPTDARPRDILASAGIE